MVSLSRSFNINSGGATFFGDSSNMDDREAMQPILESYGMFKPLTTVFPFSLHLLAGLGLEVAAIVFAILHPDEKSKCREYFILIYAHVAFWFLTLILDQIARAKHFNLRINGYLDFYKKTQVLHRLPLYIVSLWNATILFLQTLMQHYYPDDFAEKCVNGGLLSPISYFCAMLTFEYCLITGINISYILKVSKFNKLRPLPDVQKEEWTACWNDEGFAQDEVGCRQPGDKISDFVEKQADMIRHLRDHNARLGEKLMILNAQLQARNRSGN